MTSPLITPRQAAAATGTSESSVRRWCDQGRLPFERTPGGHRRIPLAALVEFARDNGLRVAISAALGTRGRGGKPAPVTDLQKRAHGSALAGDESGLRVLIADSVGTGKTLAAVCDHLLAPVLHRLGDEWQAGAIDIHHEHRATETIIEALALAKELTPLRSERDPLAMCCALSPDVYAIAPRMAALVLREVGYRTVHLGPNAPVVTIRAALDEFRPALLTVSVSHADDRARLIEDLRALQVYCRQRGVLIAVGGRALTGPVRRAITADFFGDTMCHLSTFAASVCARWTDRRKAATAEDVS